MILFLVCVVLLSGLIYAGYRLNLYLYSRGAMRTVRPVLPVQEDVEIERFSDKAKAEEFFEEIVEETEA